MGQEFSKNLIQFDRRFLLRLLLLTPFTSIFSDFSLSQKSEKLFEDILAKFQKWSRNATGFHDISLNETREYLKFCLENGVKFEDLQQLNGSVYQGTSLEKKLLEGWMTGLIHFYGDEINRHYDSMLMWRAAGLDNKPLTCQSAPLSWSLLPKSQ